MKKLIFIPILAVLLTSCSELFEDKGPEPINFYFVNVDSTPVRSVKIVLLKDTLSNLIPVDSIYISAYHINQNWQVIDPAHRFALVFEREKLSKTRRGVFEAIVTKLDGTELRKSFGSNPDIASQTAPFTVEIRKNGILVK